MRLRALPSRVPYEVWEVGVPNRTSYELHLPAEMGAWYSAVEFRRTLCGRSADACLIQDCFGLTELAAEAIAHGEG